MVSFKEVNSRIKRQRVAIIIRFSHIHETYHAFRTGKGESLEDRIAKVLSDERLQMRFAYFENVCLPSLDAQINKNFVVVLRCSDLLPEKWKKKLHELVSSRSYIYTAMLPLDEFPIPYEKRLLQDQILPVDADTVITARIDDDDAVADDYVEKLSKYLRPAFQRHAISFPNGFFMETIGDGPRKKFKLAPVRKINIAIGLAFVSSRNLGNTILSFPVNHRVLDTAVPVIIDSTKPMFIVTCHASNDTNRSELPEMLSASEINRSQLVKQLGNRLTHLNFDQIPG